MVGRAEFFRRLSRPKALFVQDRRGLDLHLLMLAMPRRTGFATQARVANTVAVLAWRDGLALPTDILS